MVRSISSCMVWAVKYDSPQRGHDHMGMPSTTGKDLPLPKLRVTRRRCTPARPHEAHTPLDEVERDDVENRRVADFDDRFGLAAIERPASDDDFSLMGLAVFLALDDGPVKGKPTHNATVGRSGSNAGLSVTCGCVRMLPARRDTAHLQARQEQQRLSIPLHVLQFLNAAIRATIYDDHNTRDDKRSNQSCSNYHTSTASFHTLTSMSFPEIRTS